MLSDSCIPLPLGAVCVKIGFEEGEIRNMKLVSAGANSVVVELSNFEIGTIADLLIEFTQGVSSPSDEEWSSLGLGSKIEGLELAECLLSFARSE